jgi:Ca-activated chloride channel family protein
MNWQFAYPIALVFASIVPLIWIVRVIAWHRRRGLMMSVPTRLAASGRSVRSLFVWFPSVLIGFGLMILCIALARPQEIIGDTKATRDTIAIELVVDRSGSMDDPVIFEGEQTNRLEAVKKIVERFVEGDGQLLKGRAGDLLGLVVFGSYADTLMPLTQSHDALIESIRSIQIPRSESERSTAIGDALMLAAGRLKAYEDAMRIDIEDPEFALKSKAIILLTDGENQAGQYSPDQAAVLAREWGMKIYIVGIQGNTSRGSLFPRNRTNINDRFMTQVAEHTGGRYWPVERISDLEKVYAEIDELERSTIEISQSTTFRELYLPYAIAGFGLLASGVFLRECVIRGGAS